MPRCGERRARHRFSSASGLREFHKVTAAIRQLDPITAAEAGIAGSKSLMAAVADDLSEHERWLAHYRLAEKRHARRVMLHELVYRLELARWRVFRLSSWPM